MAERLPEGIWSSTQPKWINTVPSMWAALMRLLRPRVWTISFRIHQSLRGVTQTQTALSATGQDLGLTIGVAIWVSAELTFRFHPSHMCFISVFSHIFSRPAVLCWNDAPGIDAKWDPTLPMLRAVARLIIFRFCRKGHYRAPESWLWDFPGNSVPNPLVSHHNSYKHWHKLGVKRLNPHFCPTGRASDANGFSWNISPSQQVYYDTFWYVSHQFGHYWGIVYR